MKRCLFLCAVPLFLSGCLSTTPPAGVDWPVVWNGTLPKASSSDYGVVRISSVDVRAPYAGRPFAVLRADGSVAFDPYNAYAAAPGRLIEGMAEDAFAASGRFAAVTGNGSSVAADVTAEISVVRLALDCRTTDVRKAVATVAVRLVRNRRIVAFARGEGTADASEPDFSAAFSSALSMAFVDALGGL